MGIEREDRLCILMYGKEYTRSGENAMSADISLSLRECTVVIQILFLPFILMLLVDPSKKEAGLQKCWGYLVHTRRRDDTATALDHCQQRSKL